MICYQSVLSHHKIIYPKRCALWEECGSENCNSNNDNEINNNMTSTWHKLICLKFESMVTYQGKVLDTCGYWNGSTSTGYVPNNHWTSFSLTLLAYQPTSLPFPLLYFISWMFVKENPDKKDTKVYSRLFQTNR